jgi:hypothetical protein
MSKSKSSNIEEVVGGAVSIPINMINGLADLLIHKGVISRQEMVSMLRHLIDNSPHLGDREQMQRLMLEAVVTRFEDPRPPGSGH